MRIVIGLAVVTFGCLVVAGLARRTLLIVTVVGTSMAPTLNDGDRVLVVRRWARRVRRGDIVAARFTPAAGWVIKRAVALGGEAVAADDAPDGTRAPATTLVPPGSVYLVGDNRSTSGDSRLWGAVPLPEVVGVMVGRLPRRG
jgi:signal peptidase I